MLTLRDVRKKSLRLENTNIYHGKIKERVKESKTIITKSFLDALNEFVLSSNANSANELFAMSQRLAAGAIDLAEKYDSPSEADFRTVLADAYLWLVAAENAPAGKIQETLDRLKSFHSQLSKMFASFSK
jgi:hypothetical protein